MKHHNVLITGGSGFIGTQVATTLWEADNLVTIVDLVDKQDGAPGAIIVRDYHEFFKHNKIKYDTVIHLAADHIVPHSVLQPEKYYVNNVIKMKEMLDCIVATGIKNIIFSSTGNIYGRQGALGLPIKEDAYYDPENPYASTKVAGEMLIKDYATAYGLNYINFRYFNAAGADPSARFGYRQQPATHVIPILCRNIINKEPFTLYGTDYDTTDGTCIRDYIHVDDLARAHQRALEFLNMGGKNETFNLGGDTGGVSVRELITHASKITCTEPIVEYAARRPGDPAVLIADISKAIKYLNWRPYYSIKDCITHSWNWEKKSANVVAK
jgi:UDP-glucose 4-epimerase